MRLLLSFLFFTALANAEPVAIPKVNPSEPLPANLFVQLAKAVNPAVVNVFTTYLPRQHGLGGAGRDPYLEFFEQFMGPQQYGPATPQQSLGSGFIIREDGLIVTNNHVIDRADVIKVQISENPKDSYDAKLVGRDARTDIALIKIDAKKKLPYVKLGSSSEVQVGEWVAAFGNPYGYGHSMTKGIISAVGREIDELNLFPFMQTDASINPGNSGGPLVNTQGQVIGVNTAIDARAQGIGFVIPIDNVKSILPQLEKNGGVARGFIGVDLSENDIDEDSANVLNLKNSDGALILRVMPHSPAEKAGVKPYDLVTGFGDSKISSVRDLRKSVANASVGAKVAMKVIRDGKPKTLSVQVGGSPEMKEMKLAATQGSAEVGQRAPFNLGFVLGDYSAAVGQHFGLARLAQPRPVVLSVDPGSEAARTGLAPGDVILDINRNSVSKARDALHAFKNGTTNILRILKEDRVVLISLRAQ